MGSLPRKFWFVWTGGSLTNLGDGIVGIALPLVAAVLTRDPLLIAGLELARFISIPFLSLFIGVWLDRYSRKWAKVGADAIRIVLMLLLVTGLMLGQLNLVLLYFLAFVLGIAELVADSAFSILVRHTVEKDRLELAYSRVSTGALVSDSFIGPPLGAWLFSIFSIFPFVVNIVTLGLSTVLIRTLKGTFKVEALESQEGIWREIRDGFGYLWSSRVLRTLALTSGGITVALRTSFSILVLYALELLGVSETTYGILGTAFGVGGVTGSFIASRLVSRFNRTLVLKGCIGLLALAYGTLALAPHPAIVWSLLCITGIAVIVWGITSTSLRQRIVPDEFLGRVGGAQQLLSSGLSPLGSLAGGIIAQQLGLNIPFVFSAALLVMLGIFIQVSISEQDIDTLIATPSN